MSDYISSVKSVSEIKLLPCPFCGEEAKLHHNTLTDKFKVWCSECDCRTDVYSDEKEAIKSWNTRKPMERINAIFKERSEKYLGEAKILRHNKSYYIARQREERAYSYIEAMNVVEEEGGIE